jgi:hypothetical protein
LEDGKRREFLHVCMQHSEFFGVCFHARKLTLAIDLETGKK